MHLSETEKCCVLSLVVIHGSIKSPSRTEQHPAYDYQQHALMPVNSADIALGVVVGTDLCLVAQIKELESSMGILTLKPALSSVLCWQIFLRQ